jgi:hypothetical protein
VARTRIEIEDELANLKNLRDKVPQLTAFGDDNQEAIDAQVRVIEERLDYEDVLEEFEEEGDHILSHALTALEWLEEDDVPPSEGWAELVVLVGAEVVLVA